MANLCVRESFVGIPCRPPLHERTVRNSHASIFRTKMPARRARIPSPSRIVDADGHDARPGRSSSSPTRVDTRRGETLMSALNKSPIDHEWPNRRSERLSLDDEKKRKHLFEKVAALPGAWIGASAVPHQIRRRGSISPSSGETASAGSTSAGEPFSASQSCSAWIAGMQPRCGCCRL